MTTSPITTFPLDSQLVVYRQGNDTEAALSAAYITAGDVFAERTESHAAGVQSFVYRILQPGYPRYYPVYRMGSIGEVYEVQYGEQETVMSFSVRSPSAGAPSAINHHLETLSVLYYLLEEDKHASTQQDFAIISSWIAVGEEGTEDRYTVHCTPYTEV
ncbi:hypothetical protein B0H14DRAFT_1604050 [Mycena olivaceomarginata]|nr:hypothetical protein B0H14DRAFT_1604050 [Mycena olivaceomarginata]